MIWLFEIPQKKHNVLTGIVGTSIYCSPEVVDDSYNEKSDEQSNIDFDTPELKKVSENCKNLMQRITAFGALKHPFFTEKLNPMKILTKHMAYCCFHFIN